MNAEFTLEFKCIFTGLTYNTIHKHGDRLKSASSKTGVCVMSKSNVAVKSETNSEQAQAIRPKYLEALALVERLHRRLLDVIKDEFDRRGRNDVNSVQALLLYNIGDNDVTASELRTRGYYLGSNVSYNVKKLVELGYLSHQRSRVDRRSVRIRLAPKGEEVHKIVASLYEKHVRTIEQIGGIAESEFETLNQSLLRLDRFWTDQIRYRL
jgi:DNA-binding MarR family transcriptional regulator